MFKLDEIVMVKRTGGKWEEGKIVDILPFEMGVVVEVDVTDMLQGYVYTGEPMKAYKTISVDKYTTHLMKMKTLAWQFAEKYDIL